MRRMVERSIAKNFPDLARGKDGLFYETPVAHVVTGFVCDLTPTFLRVEHLHMPLYDLSSGTHLSFSERIFDEVRKDLASRDASERISVAIADRRSAKKRLFEIEDLLMMIERDIESLPRYLANPPYRKLYATSLIMLGRFEEAEQQLLIIQRDFGYASDEVIEDVNATLASLSQGNEATIRYRKRVEDIMVDRIGIDKAKCVDLVSQV